MKDGGEIQAFIQRSLPGVGQRGRGGKGAGGGVFLRAQRSEGEHTLEPLKDLRGHASPHPRSGGGAGLAAGAEESLREGAEVCSSMTCAGNGEVLVTVGGVNK